MPMMHNKHGNCFAARLKAQRDASNERLVMDTQKLDDIIGMREKGAMTEPETVLAIVEVIAAERDRAVKCLLTQYLSSREPLLFQSF